MRLANACPSEDEMDKKLEQMLVDKYRLWELVRKIWKAWYNEWYDVGYSDWCDKYYDNDCIS